MRLEVITIVGDETAGGYFLNGIFYIHIVKYKCKKGKVKKL